MTSYENIKVSFRLNFKDYLSFQLYNYTRPLSLGSGLLICLWLGAIFSSRDLVLYSDWSSLLVAFTIALFLRFILVPIFEMRVLLFFTKRMHILTQDIVITLTPESLFSVRDYVQVAYRWEVIRAVVRTHSAIYIFQFGGYAVIIPQRAFSSIIESERFYVLASEYWRAIQANKSVKNLKQP